MNATAGRIRIVACGALAHELSALRRSCPTIDGNESVFEISCLPPELHNTPDAIPAAVEAQIIEAKAAGERVFVAYADCGTGGLLDAVLVKHQVDRLPGAHCYEFYAGSEAFAKMADEEPGTFYLTDFLVRHFERLVVQSLGIDRHPELINDYFRHYRRVVYLRQSDKAGDSEQAKEIATRLGLHYEEVVTGLGDLAQATQQWLKQRGLQLVTETAEAVV